MARGQAKKGNRETRRERERKEDVSKMGCIHTHTLLHRNTVDMYLYKILSVFKKYKQTHKKPIAQTHTPIQHDQFICNWIVYYYVYNKKLFMFYLMKYIYGVAMAY